VGNPPQLQTLRILREEHEGDEAATLLFLEEARRVTTLRNKGFLEVLQKNLQTPRPWYLTESIEVESLADVVERGESLDDEAACALAEQLIEAFQHLADRRQVYLDPRPGNLLRHGQAWKLRTFRAIAAADEVKQLARRKIVDPGFAPPERWPGQTKRPRAASFATWALGALTRFALGGGPPMTEEGQAAPLARPLSEEWRTCFERLLAADPERRPLGPAALRRCLPVLCGDSRAPAAAAPVPKRKRR
jgi:serine/threonine-protein kinase